jgi:asparagine synthetase B (glutamine-hydrolysing)
LSNLGLEVKPDWQIVDVEKQGVDFVGYVFYSDKTRLRKKIADNFCKHAKKAAKRKITPSQSLLGFAAYKGWLMRANCKALWRSKVSYSTVRYCDNVFKRNSIKAAL